MALHYTLVRAGTMLLLALGASMLVGCAERASDGGKVDGKKGEAVPTANAQAEVKVAGRTTILGYSAAGSLSGFLGDITFEVREIRPLEPPGPPRHGVLISLSSRAPNSSNASFVAYDEIDPLIRGIERLEMIDKSVTPFESFQADFRTNGDFRVSVYNSRGGEIAVSVSSGSGLRTSVELKHSDLAKLKTLLSTAKQKLDAAKAAIK